MKKCKQVWLLCRNNSSKGNKRITQRQKIGYLEDFIVLADVMGGTPCNVVSRLILEGEPIELYAGMNLPMVIEFINSELIGNELSLVSAGAQAICSVNEQILSIEVEEE